jgi:UDP-N-acetylglucosamine--N-acetylmuramyl-(pentapeptide) pyrophosphoryl-undecaprenol N-acetylglucosamine transferase
MPPEARPDVVHQAGEKNFEALRKCYRDAGVQAEVLAFIDDMAARYAWCDVLIARSGAITIAEIAVAGVAAILVPLPWFVAEEQAGNAKFLESRAAAIRLAQLETTPQRLAALLGGLTRDKLATMAAKARALGKPDATVRCADLCERMAA